MTVGRYHRGPVLPSKL